MEGYTAGRSLRHLALDLTGREQALHHNEKAGTLFPGVPALYLAVLWLSSLPAAAARAAGWLAYWLANGLARNLGAAIATAAVGGEALARHVAAWAAVALGCARSRAGLGAGAASAAGKRSAYSSNYQGQRNGDLLKHRRTSGFKMVNLDAYA